MLFYFFLASLFLSDIFINNQLFRSSFYLSLILLLVFLLINIIKNRSIFIPKGSILFILFLFFSFISVFFAVDKQVALETVLIYTSTFLVFVLSFNNKDKIKKGFSLFIIYSSVIFILIFILGKLLKLNFITEGGSLFFTGYYHNELGNYLALGSLVSLDIFFKKNKAFFGFLFIIFLFSVLLTYSRTGYLALFIGILILITQNKYKRSMIKPLIVFFSLFFLLLFFFITTKNFNLPELSSFRNFLINKTSLSSEKELLGKRNIYFLYSLSSIAERPLFGVGPGNFYYAASKRQVNYGENTTTAHNIVLEILAENGLLAGSFFLLFLIYALIKAKKDIYLYLFLSLTIIFLTCFSYRFNSFLFLWFILLGLIIEDKKILFLNNYIIMFFILIIYQPVLLGQFLFNLGDYKKSLLIYPFQKGSYIKLIEQSIKKKNHQKAKKYLIMLDKLFREKPGIALEEAQYYDILKDKEKAVYFYEKRINFYPFSIVLNEKSILDRILALNISLYGRYLGRKKTAIFLKDILIHINKEKKDSPIVHRIEKFCQINNVRCYNY